MLWRTHQRLPAKEQCYGARPTLGFVNLALNYLTFNAVEKGLLAKQTPDKSAQQSSQLKPSSNSSQAQTLDHDSAS